MVVLCVFDNRMNVVRAAFGKVMVIKKHYCRERVTEKTETNNLTDYF